MLADGPLDRARRVLPDLPTRPARWPARTPLGQAHLRLTPDALRWTRGSGIKITGLGIDAALAGDGLTGDAARRPADRGHHRPRRRCSTRR